ncbi:hypothetical protein ACLIBH_07075 [Virgibacillus sp. W0430]|uniref:hypothetical protein n=1 Tax=Virgibacillus sp. W0430 TaxID=3391580 RepID=UPI003F4778A2
MKEQEKLTNMLRKLIKDTEACKIKTSDEMIRALINELNTDYAVATRSIAN